MNEIGSFKPSIAMKGLKTGAMSRELVDKTTRIDGAGTSNFTVVLWFLLGLMCLGRCQSSCFVTYVMVDVIVFATLWKPDKWSGHISCAIDTIFRTQASE